MVDCNSCAVSGACPSASPNGSCGSSAPDPKRLAEAQKKLLEDKTPPAQGASIKHVLAVASGKGGVGKSLVSSLLAVQLSRLGLKVGIMDADMTGPSIPQAFGVQDQMATAATETLIQPVRTKTGMQLISINVLLEDPSSPVVWRGPVIASVVKQFWQEVLWEDLDVLVIDMPPGTGDVPLTVYQSLPVDALVLVATPQDLVTLIVHKAKKMADSLSVPLMGLIENMSYFQCPSCSEKHNIFGAGKIAKAAEEMNIPLLAEIPIDPALSQLVDAGDIESIRSTVLGDAALKLWMNMEKRSKYAASKELVQSSDGTKADEKALDETNISND